MSTEVEDAIFWRMSEDGNGRTKRTGVQPVSAPFYIARDTCFIIFISYRDYASRYIAVLSRTIYVRSEFQKFLNKLRPEDSPTAEQANDNSLRSGGLFARFAHLFLQGKAPTSDKYLYVSSNTHSVCRIQSNKR
jgi:hypothetical protein